MSSPATTQIVNQSFITPAPSPAPSPASSPSQPSTRSSKRSGSLIPEGSLKKSRSSNFDLFSASRPHSGTRVEEEGVSESSDGSMVLEKKPAPATPCSAASAYKGSPRTHDLSKVGASRVKSLQRDYQIGKGTESRVYKGNLHLDDESIIPVALKLRFNLSRPSPNNLKIWEQFSSSQHLVQTLNTTTTSIKGFEKYEIEELGKGDLTRYIF